MAFFKAVAADCKPPLILEKNNLFGPSIRKIKRWLMEEPDSILEFPLTSSNEVPKNDVPTRPDPSLPWEYGPLCMLL